MKYSIVTADYDYDTNDINIYCRDQNYKKIVKKIHGFDPYAYAESEFESELLSKREVVSVQDAGIPHIESNSKYVRFITNSPRDVGEIRKNSKFEVCEGDIPFPRRFMIDKGIFFGFSAPAKKEILHPHELEPIEFIQKPRTAYLDIETDIKDGFVTIICIYDSITDRYVSVALDTSKSAERNERFAKDHLVYYVKSEERLFDMVNLVLTKIDPDVVTAWYIDFDRETLDKRSAHFKKSIQWNRCNVFDMLEPYKKLYNKGSNKLKDVIIAENIDIPEYEPYQQKFWKDDLKRGILANKSHVKSIVLLDKKLEIIETYWNFKAIAGVEDMAYSIYHGSVIDVRLLRKYHGKFILPSKPSGETIRARNAELTEKIGGKVFEPPYGRFEDVSFYDMSRYYPELIISQNLTFETVKDSKLGLFPELAMELIEERLKYDRRLDKLEAGSEEHKRVKYLRDTVKFVLNSMFGYSGWSGARCFNLNIFNGITTKGQEGLMFIRDCAKNDSKSLIYGDTDSNALVMPNNDDCKSLIKDPSLIEKLLNEGTDPDHVYTIAHSIEYTDTLNEYLKEFSKKNGFTRNLELKLDRYFSNILFKRVDEVKKGQHITRGAKKKYVGTVCWEKRPVNYLKIIGFEYVRKDASRKTKEIQPNVFSYILKGNLDELEDYIRKTISDIKELYESGKLEPLDIAIPTTLSKDPTDYGGLDKNGRKLTPPDYVRGALFANKWLGENIHASDQVHMVYVKLLPSYPETDTISFTDQSLLPKDLVIDIDKHIERTIKMPLEDVLSSVNMNWKDVVSPNRTLW